MAQFSEQQELEELVDGYQKYGRVRREEVVESQGGLFPIYSVVLGPDDPQLPTTLLVGGVHGLERIGSRVVIAFMQSILRRLKWDQSLHYCLEHMRLAFYPIANPGGMFLNWRSNPRGVDLMRNAPIEADESLRWFLPGGHRISSRLPWYRGKAGLEKESKAMIDFVHREVFPSRYAVALDVHSGFGMVDRLWFPYAYSRRSFPRLAEVYALLELLNQTLMNHIYWIEPQSSSYMTHGDLWDYMFNEHQRLSQGQGKIFLPLALEMGSWLWVKKNPRQLLSLFGLFNPILPHRSKRTLRRHMPLLDFLLRSTLSHQQWLPLEGESHASLKLLAHKEWFQGQKSKVIGHGQS